MKRINPDTGQPFKRGDKREDGKVFKNYSGKLLTTGFEGEVWVAPEQLAKRRAQQRSFHQSQTSKTYKARRNEIKDKGLGKKRPNPLTGKNYRTGYKDQTTGKIFMYYELHRVLDSGVFSERWVSEAAYIRKKEKVKKARRRVLENASHVDKLEFSIQKSKRRARDKKQEFSVSTDYLLSIYPENGLCPVLGVKMELGGDRENSPSLDRIDNAKGYVAGNY